MNTFNEKCKGLSRFGQLDRLYGENSIQVNVLFKLQSGDRETGIWHFAAFLKSLQYRFVSG